MHNVQSQRNTRRRESEKNERYRFRRVGRKNVRGEFADVGVNRTAFFNRVHNGSKIIVRQDHGSGFLGHITAADTHRHTNVGFL